MPGRDRDLEAGRERHQQNLGRIEQAEPQHEDRDQRDLRQRQAE
jgi:hypothetical protein